MDITAFRNLPLLGILRGITDEMVDPITSITLTTGLPAIEVTMNTPNACSLIANFREKAASRFSVGAGTVLSVEDVEHAINAGAQFIVCPNTNVEVINYCVVRNIPIFPGALTPTEIFQAWNAGATMVKLFPANTFGSSYIKDIKGPFNDIEILACGGISPENIGNYFSNGASAIAFGSSIFNINLLQEKKYTQIEDLLTKLIAAYKANSALL